MNDAILSWLSTHGFCLQTKVHVHCVSFKRDPYPMLQLLKRYVFFYEHYIYYFSKYNLLQVENYQLFSLIENNQLFIKPMVERGIHWELGITIGNKAMILIKIKLIYVKV